MALFQCKIFSKELFRSVSVDVMLPTPESGDYFFGSKTFFPKSGQKYQVLYLLHGFSADHTDWQRFSRIETYAQKRQLAVVMPSVNNSFYTNLPNGANFYNFYTRELPDMMESIFPISSKAENRFVAGLSMGGYGAFKAALRNPDRYAAAASLSGGMRIARPDQVEENGINTPTGIPTASYLFGAYGKNYENYKPEEEDIFIALKDHMDKGTKLPKLYQCCGTEDFVYANNVMFRDYARDLGAELTYEEGPGIHDWDFWDPYIRRVVEWLPLRDGFVD